MKVLLAFVAGLAVPIAVVRWYFRDQDVEVHPSTYLDPDYPWGE